MEVEASLVMQAAVSAAVTEGARVLVVMGAPAWSSLPPPWHLMSPVTPDIMKTISFIYPKGVQVMYSEFYVRFTILKFLFLHTLGLE